VLKLNYNYFIKKNTGVCRGTGIFLYRGVEMKDKKRKKTIYFDESTINDIEKMSKKYGITQRQLIKDAINALKDKISGRLK
jgi:Mor family transcriptional regulator